MFVNVSFVKLKQNLIWMPWICFCWLFSDSESDKVFMDEKKRSRLDIKDGAESVIMTLPGDLFIVFL